MKYFLTSIIVFLIVCLQNNILLAQVSLLELLKENEKKHQHHSGLILLDATSGKIVVDFNANKNFIPASNFKILTLFTSLHFFGDSIPALEYFVQGDNLYFRGTGDPAFLHPKFKDQPALVFLKESDKNLYYVHQDLEDDLYGPGWAWEDYVEDFSPERSVLPMYGNVVWIKSRAKLPCCDIMPTYFENAVDVHVSIMQKKNKLERHLYRNVFDLTLPVSNSKVDIQVPWRNSKQVVTTLLKDTIDLQGVAIAPENAQWKTIYRQKSTSLYKHMMYESDNFFAEQLLLMASKSVADTMKIEAGIRYFKENLAPLADEKIKWLDGSGLSRYNLIKPAIMGEVLKNMYQTIPQNILFTYFPTGGRHGTLSNLFVASQPYVFAKSGSMSQVYNLSGFIVAKSGKTYIFSFMNNSLHTAVKDYKKDAEQIINAIYELY
ncbi:MAG: D-alanyl-D-alanine carboxypeptidase [Cyclobacteriaceae bacterium]